jgi:hypothetical protein
MSILRRVQNITRTRPHPGEALMDTVPCLSLHVISLELRDCTRDRVDSAEIDEVVGSMLDSVLGMLVSVLADRIDSMTHWSTREFLWYQACLGAAGPVRELEYRMEAHSYATVGERAREGVFMTRKNHRSGMHRLLWNADYKTLADNVSLTSKSTDHGIAQGEP